MNLYLLKRFANPEESVFEYEIYLAAIVSANSEQEARLTHPAGLSNYYWNGKTWWAKHEFWSDDDNWPPPDKVIVDHIGVTATDAVNQTVLLSYYKHG